MSAPQQIGPYRVVRPLGRGGMGAVYLARDQRLDRTVALKLFSGSEARSDFARHELLDEARAAAAFSHPHIAAVHDVLDVDGEVAIVFEYVEGETLAERLAHGPLGVNATLDVATQLADALGSAHQHGIVHRDLKPANIVISPDGVVKVLDFGVARVMPEGIDDANVAHTTVAGFVGTMGYAAPEQCLGQAVDARADIFSLGVVMFEMLTGRRPFVERDNATLVRAMLSSEAPRVRSLVPAVPVELDALIASMLSADRAKRPARAPEVRDAIRAVADAVRQPHRIAMRRPWLIAALLLAAAVIGALVATIGRREPANPAAKAPVVAVLPLTNASGDDAKDYLAVGVTDSLITRLAGVPSVTVLSRAAVADAQRRARDIPALARELDATYFVDGTVQQIADGLRISLSLIARDGAVAWADTVQGPFESFFALQGRLASALGNALSVRLSAADRASLAHQPTSNPQALDAYWRGRALLERRDIIGNSKLALAMFDEAIRAEPRFADAHAARGEALWFLYLETKNTDHARAALEAGTEALRLQPNSAEVRYAQALALEGTGRHDEAIEELQRALALRPNYEDARRRLGQILAREGRIDEAIAEYQKAIELRPNSWANFSALGLSLYQADRYEEAAKAFSRVIELQPESALGYQQLGVTYQVLGKTDAALENYRKAIAIAPLPQAYSAIGVLLHERGDFEGAVDAYQRAIALRPNSHVTHRNLGDALRRLGRQEQTRRAYRQAVALAEEQLKINPKSAGTVASLAVYHAKLGDFESADRFREQALALEDDDTQVLYDAAVVLALQRRRDEAVQLLQRAVSAGYSRTIIAEDEDFASLGDLEAFQQLVGPVRGQKERQ
jgi:tetratricopeptide (TPR) repeat protein